MIKIKIKKEKLNSKWYRFLGNTIFAIVFMLIESALCIAIGIGVGTFFDKVSVSQTFTCFKKPGDFILAFVTLLSMVVGAYLITKMYEYSKNKLEHYSFKKYLLGMVGFMMVTSSILGIFGEFTSFPNSKITVKAIKQTAAWTEVNYNLSFILMVLTVILMVFMSKKWIEQNYWYVVGDFILPLIYLRQLLVSHLNWEKFINAKSTTYTMLAKMFAQAKHAGVTSINISIMNSSVKIALFCSWACLLSLIIIGGAFIVIRQKEKIRKRLEEKAV